jgi:hypothetical protein
VRSTWAATAAAGLAAPATGPSGAVQRTAKRVDGGGLPGARDTDRFAHLSRKPVRPDQGIRQPGGAADGEARAPLEPLHQRAAVDGLELALEAVDGLAIVLTLRFVGP